MGRSPAKPAKRGQQKFTPGGLRVKHYFDLFSASRSFVNALQRGRVERADGEIDRRPQAAIGLRKFRGRVSHELDRAGGQCSPSRGADTKIEQQVTQLVKGRIRTDACVDVETSRRQDQSSLS
jgi:hypothetical protein